MRVTAANDSPNRRNAPARLALATCALVALAVITFACGGDGAGGAGDSPPQETPVITVALPSVPPESVERTGLLVYGDTSSGQTFALNLSNGERLPVTAAAGFVIAFDCTRNGRLIAFAHATVNAFVSVMAFSGEGAPSEGMEVLGGIVGMAWSPSADRIAMTLVDADGYHLSILDVSSGQTTTLPSITGTPGAPRWSPDGQRLVFDLNNNGRSDIQVLEIGASSPVKVSTRATAFTPDWSPDGRTIAFSGGEDQEGSPQLYAVDPDGRNERKLTASETQKWSPRWSLDGSLISYTGLVTVPGVSVLPVRVHHQAVWVAGPDGSNEILITELSADAQPLAWCLRGAWLQ